MNVFDRAGRGGAWAGAAVAGLALLSGCQLFGLDDREFEINLPEVPVGPVQFKGSLMRLQHCPQADEIAGVDAISIQIAQGIATNLLDPSNDAGAGIQPYADRINGVTVSKITYKIAQNTIRRDLQPIGIYFGPLESAADPTAIDLEKAVTEQGAGLYGSTRTVEEGTTTNDEFVPVLQNPSGQAKVRKFLSSFQFSTLFGTELTLTPEDCQNLGGELEIEARIGIVLFVEPI